MFGMSLLLWALLVYGTVQIVTFSQLLDGFRNWYLKRSGYPRVGSVYQMTQPTPPNPTPLFLQFIFKLVSCWLCTAFWTGTLLSVAGYGPYQNPLASGIVAVGVICIVKFVTERNTGG